MQLSFIILIFFITFNYGFTFDFIDLSKFVYNIYEIFGISKFSFHHESPDVKMSIMFLNGTIFGRQNKICIVNEIMNHKIIFYKNQISLTIPFNVSCGYHCKHFFQFEPKVIRYRKCISLSLEPGANKDYHYLISLSSNSTGNYSRWYITKYFNNFLLRDLHDETWYQICIASIDHSWVTSLFKCVTIKTNVQHNISVFAEIHKIFVTWNDTNVSCNLQGYIVRLKGVDSKLCRTILLTITNDSITNFDHSCNHEQHEYWKYFQILSISNLPAYSRFIVDLIPIKNNQPQNNYQSVSIQTKQGESEPIRDFVIKLRTKKWILIKFKPPTQSNGNIIKYRIRIILEKINICTFKDDIISDLFYDNKLWHYVEMSNITKCGDYVIEVAPVNGWEHNNGIGKSLNYSFRFPMNENVKLLLKLKPLKTNGINFYLDDSNNHCNTIGYVVELINTYNSSDCLSMILSDTDCETLRDSILEKIGCFNIEYFQKTNKYNVSFYGLNWPILRSHFNIYRITDKVERIISEDIQISNINKLLTRKIVRQYDYTKFTKFCNN